MEVSKVNSLDDGKLNAHIESNSASDVDETKKTTSGTKQDVCEVNRMGKRQQLHPNFRFVSIVGFVIL